MVTARNELLFYLLAVLVGGLVLRNVFLAERPPALRMEGFTEAQNLPLAADSRLQSFGTQDTSSIAPGSFVGENFIWFATRDIGDEIIFELRDLESGLYALEVFLAPSGDFGIVQLSLNGEEMGAPADLHPSVFRYREPLVFRQVSLQRDNRLSLRVVGSNPATSAPHHQIGIDGINLRRLAP
jgi:hypothetical protein